MFLMFIGVCCTVGWLLDHGFIGWSMTLVIGYGVLYMYKTWLDRAYPVSADDDDDDIL